MADILERQKTAHKARKLPSRPFPMNDTLHVFGSLLIPLQLK